MTQLDEIKRVKWTLEQLQPISRKLQKIGERRCNGQTGRQELRDRRSQINLRLRAQELAHSLNLNFYHQTDPRGCAVYLIDDTMDDSTYNRGIAIY